jgi:hypothetical protein
MIISNMLIQVIQASESVGAAVKLAILARILGLLAT